MTSTGNDIVALKAINVARTIQPQFYSKIVSPAEKEIYGRQFHGTLPLEHFVWLLWSVKESAYKYAQRLTPDLVFSPTRTVIGKLIPPKSNPTIELEGIGFVDEQVYKGTVTINGQTLYYRSLVSDDFIFSVINDANNFADTYWGIQYINSSEPEHQSQAVRELLTARLTQLFPGGKWQIEKSPHGYPVLLRDGFEMEMPVSLAHHEGWVGYAFGYSDLRSKL
jgi:phosphopantetheinyl transferase (holo-ACP synthase)